jgi:hypothetical protein
MKSDLTLPKGKKVKKPAREPDMTSKRGVPYWFGPEWVRDQNGTIGRIVPLKKKGKVELNMLSKDGNVTYIQGSIQEEFRAWHEDRAIDAILLGVDEDDIIATNWEYE